MSAGNPKAFVQLLGPDLFEAQTPSGHIVRIDTDSDRSSAPSPMELLLIALGSCAGVDVASILKKKREDELFNREKEVRDLQRKRFGFEGDLFKKRQELIKPIQDKVYNAIQKIAVNRMYDLILDKSEGITVIFADPKLDKSDDVLKELGVK